MKYLSSLVLFLGTLIGTVFFIPTEAPVSARNLGVALPQAAAVFETSLQSAITSSATTMTLTANSVRGGGTLSGHNCFTVDEGSAQAEFICGIVSGTTVSSLTRGVSPLTGTTTIAALQFAHRRGANVKISDFPLIQILKAQANGEDTYPNLLQYSTTVNITSGSPTTTIATKSYVDGVAVAGASDANETTKGIIELATGAEAAAGTSAGGTGARLALPTSLCNSTSSATILCVMTSSAGKISQGFLDLTQSFTWTGTHTFNGTNLLLGNSTKLGIGTTSPYTSLGVVGEIVSTSFNATSTTATSTVSGNLAVSNNATTSNMFISNTCRGCLSGYERITNTGAGPTSANGAASVTATCSAGKRVIGGGGSNPGNTTYPALVDSYPGSNLTSWIVTYVNTYQAGTIGANTMTVYAICVNF